MLQAHSVVQLHRFNVHWIVEQYGLFKGVKEECPTTGVKVPLIKLGWHSVECSVVEDMMHHINHVADSFHNMWR